MAMVNLAELGKLINEAAESDSTNGKLFTNIRSENENDSKDAKKDGEERIKDSTPEGNSTEIKGYRGENQPYGRNALNLNYDSIDKKYQDRVKALVQGKSSPDQPDIDDETSGGISIKGNKGFWDKMQNDNKGYANIMGTTQINTRITQQTKTPKFSTDESKVKKGDVFVESKNNIKLTVVGLNEDKTRINFVDESGKKYSLAVPTFKKVVNENKMVRGNSQLLNEVVPLIPIAVNAAGIGASALMNRNKNKGEAEGEVNEEVNEVIGAVVGAAGRAAAGKAAAGTAARTAGKTAAGSAAKTAGTQSCKDIAKQVAVDAGTKAAMTDSTAAGQKVGDAVGDKVNDTLGIGDEKKNENKIKRLKFNKTVFLNENHVKSLIPEQYKTPGNKFVMVDKAGNEYLMECDNYNQSFILEYKNPEKLKNSFDNMKRLWEYSPKKAVGGASLNEAAAQDKIQKTIRNYRKKK